MTRNVSVVLVLAAGLGAACGGGSDSVPSGTDGSGRGAPTALVSVTPAAGATGVAVGTPITLRFSGGMGAGMEQWVDLHRGDLSGEQVDLVCGWSGDRILLTCTLVLPLAPHTTYTIHLGGGMRSAEGVAVDYTAHGPGLGGQWVMGGMMTGSHGGMAWGTMGSGWRNANGSYGMVFTFTTG